MIGDPRTVGIARTQIAGDSESPQREVGPQVLGDDRRACIAIFAEEARRIEDVGRQRAMAYRAHQMRASLTAELRLDIDEHRAAGFRPGRFEQHVGGRGEPAAEECRNPGAWRRNAVSQSRHPIGAYRRR